LGLWTTTQPQIIFGKEKHCKRIDMLKKVNPHYFWKKRPDELQIRERINQFMTLISQKNFESANDLCPPSAPEYESSSAKKLLENLFFNMEGMDEEFYGRKTLVKEDLDSWCLFITPPKDMNFELFGLKIYNDSGDVEANVYLGGVVSDITSIFTLSETIDGWILKFKIFKVM
jgi:hypothetical protein